jgi:hypothetical protein
MLCVNFHFLFVLSHNFQRSAFSIQQVQTPKPES